LSLKNFFLVSILIHAGILFGLYLIPEERKSEPAPFSARLVTPDELPRVAELPEARRTKPSPPPPAPARKAEPPASLPVPPASPGISTSIPVPDEPVVPGIGKEDGKPLPEGIYPKAEAEDSRGQDNGSSSAEPSGSGSAEDMQKKGFSLREKLYDPEVIGDIAMRDKGPVPKKDESISFDTSDYRYAGYMRKLKSKIESIWVYPPEARSKGLYGDLKIRFTILKSGRLGAVELVRTSGYKLLDDAAIRALKEGEPYWPLPSEWGMESYTITGHFIYSMYGYSVR
jgi:periplasmic protein TonB